MICELTHLSALALSSLPQSTPDELNAAVESASKAFETWKSTPVTARTFFIKFIEHPACFRRAPLERESTLCARGLTSGHGSISLAVGIRRATRSSLLIRSAHAAAIHAPAQISNARVARPDDSTGLPGSQARSRVMFKLQELIKANMDTLAVRTMAR